MVMRDSSFAKMSVEKWHESLAPKVDGSWNLHQLLPSDLDFFVMLSSSTGIMGSFGQSNYTVGNTYQDALAAHRTRHGQRAHTLALSMVTGVGYVAQNEQVQALLRVRGMLEEVPMDDIFKLLRFCCNADRVDKSTIGPQIITPLTLPADLRAMGIVAPLGSTRPIYHYLDTLPSRFSSDTASAEAKNRPSYKLSEASSLAQATDIVVEAIQTQLSSLLVVSKDDIDPQKAIYRYGVDSLVAVEMRNWFSKAIGADVGTVDIMSDISIWLLAVKVAGKSKFVKEELKE
jgi:aryl carrier-like protein